MLRFVFMFVTDLDNLAVLNLILTEKITKMHALTQTVCPSFKAG